MKSGFIFIANNVFETLFAISQEEQAIGLMNQPWPPPIMSFVYDKPKINKFWMHRTPSPLDIVFCCNNKIIDIYKGEPHSTSVIGPDQYSDLVIELPYGTAASMNFKLGYKVGVIVPKPHELHKMFNDI